MINKEGYSIEESEWAQQQIKPYAEICGISDKDLGDLSLIYVETIERRRRALSESNPAASSQTAIESFRTVRRYISEDPTDMDIKRMSFMTCYRKATAIMPVVGLIVAEAAQAVTGQNIREYYPLLATPLGGTAISQFFIWVDRNSYREVKVPV